MGYKVDFDALDTMYSEISQQVSNWTTELQDVAKSINDLVSSDKLTGKGAENIISYFQTVHVAIMQSMMTLLQSHSTYCLMYKSDYQTNIDSSLHAVIHSKELFEIMTKLRVQRTNTTLVDSDIRKALTSISHIVNINLTSSAMMEDMYATIGRDLVNLDSDIVQLENTHLNNDFEETQELIKSLIAFINEYLSTDKTAKAEYEPSQMANSKKYGRLYKALGYLTKKNQMSAMTLGLQQAFDHEEERRSLLEDEAAKKREEEGILNAVLAVGAIVIGAVAIVATWGAATPLVVTACVAGGSAMAYGASNLVEAGQDIYYGSIGDPYTVAFNPIRDTVFCGNQELYDLWGGVATDVAGMLIPIGIASKAAKAAEIGSKTADIGSKAAKAAEIASKTKKIQTAVSGVHGAISAGFGNVKQQFYEKGSLEAIDWGEVAGKSTIGGITGTATAYGGAKLSESLTTKLSQNAFVDSLLHSDSAAKRVAMNMAVSSTSEVGTGVGTRFLGGFLTTGGNVKEAWAQAINPQSILFDATLGASMGGVKGLQKPQQINANLNSPEQSNADVKPLENTVKHQNSLKNESGSQPYAPTYHVEPDMHQQDIKNGVYHDGQYDKNPTAQNLSDAIKGNYVVSKTFNDDKLTYVVDLDGNIIFGKRNGNGKQAGSLPTPHPTLIGGKDPQVKVAGILKIRGGKIYSYDNQSGHFKPNIKSIETADEVFGQLPKQLFHKDFKGGNQ